MKLRVVLASVIVALLAGMALAVNYQPIVFDSQGLNLNEQSMNAPANASVKLDNFYTGIDRSSTNRLGAISKTLGRTTHEATMPVSGKSRGMFYFPILTLGTTNPDLAWKLNFVTTSESTNCYLLGNWNFPSNAWYVLNSETLVPFRTVPFHFSFATNYDYYATNNGDTVFMANGVRYDLSVFGSFVKFQSGTGLVVPVQDVNSTATLTGKLYFENATNAVTGEGTLFTTEAYGGKWIKASATSPYYQVYSAISNTSLTLGETYQETTASTTAAKVSQDSGYRPFVLFNWFNRMWGANDAGTVAQGGNGILRCSAAFSSTTRWGMEDWTGTDTGYVYTNVERISALNGTDNYLFVFGDTTYNVYQYDSTIVPPIALAKTWNYGCPYNNTIAEVDNGLIYYTGNDVRFTTGFSDTSIAGSIKNYLTYTVPGASMLYYYSLTSNDNGYPCAIYDEVNKLYHLYLPAYGVELTYDWTKQLWVGQDNFNNVGTATKVYSTLTSTMNQIVYHPVSGGNQLYSINQNAGTSATGEIQSADLMLGDAKQMKRVNWVEFWVHPSGTAETTLAFNYFVDGKQGLSTPLYALVYDSTGGNNTYQKVRFPVNTNAQYFRWQLKDISALKHGSTEAQSYPGQISIVGGNIAFDYNQGL